MDNSFKQSILKKFKTLSEADLMIEIYNEIVKFMLLVESEKEATRILYKYGRKVCFKFNDAKKERFHEFIVCSKMMDFVIPEEWYQVSVSDDDIIERIEELMRNDISWLDSHAYLYDCGEDRHFLNNKVLEIMAFYKDIIVKEFGDRKNFVKQISIVL